MIGGERVTYRVLTSDWSRNLVLTSDRWRFIVNSVEEDTEYQQIVRVGRCMGNHECSGSWPGQITQVHTSTQIFFVATQIFSQCRQQYLDHKLVVLSLSGEILLDNFNFPSCCACHVLNIEY